jgi:hypothetical protein
VSFYCWSFFIHTISVSSSTAIPAGGIAGIIIGVLALMILVLLILLVLRRRRGQPDDRNLHMYEAHKEGAAIAYVPELDVPEPPSSLQVSRQVDTTFASEKRLWQTSHIFVPASEVNQVSSVDEPDELATKQIFAVDATLSWSAASTIHENVAAEFYANVWNEEEAKSEAQQRRKEQREATWARKKFERLAQEISGEGSDRPASSFEDETFISDVPLGITSSFDKIGVPATLQAESKSAEAREV